MLDWDQIISPLIGGSIGLAIAKYFLTSAISKFEILDKSLIDIKSQLTILQVKLELLEKLHDLTKEHDRKITYLESREAHVSPSRYKANSKD